MPFAGDRPSAKRHVALTLTRYIPCPRFDRLHPSAAQYIDGNVAPGEQAYLELGLMDEKVKSADDGTSRDVPRLRQGGGPRSVDHIEQHAGTSWRVGGQVVDDAGRCRRDDQRRLQGPGTIGPGPDLEGNALRVSGGVERFSSGMCPKVDNHAVGDLAQRGEGRPCGGPAAQDGRLLDASGPALAEGEDHPGYVGVVGVSPPAVLKKDRVRGRYDSRELGHLVDATQRNLLERHRQRQPAPRTVEAVEERRQRRLVDIVAVVLPSGQAQVLVRRPVQDGGQRMADRRTEDRAAPYRGFWRRSAQRGRFFITRSRNSSIFCLFFGSEA
jgi:hypothetical protein